MVAILPQRQLQDLEAELRRRGRSLNDFELAATAGMPAIDSLLQPAVSWVSIRHLESGIRREYRYGQWLVDFLRDLDAGAFRSWSLPQDRQPRKLAVRI